MAKSNKETIKTEQFFSAINPYIEINIPSPKEEDVRGKEFVAFGNKNNYPEYLWSLYQEVPTLSSVINGTVDYICGNDDLWPVFLGLGSRCLITAAGNTMAPAMVKIYKLFEQGQTAEAMNVFRKAWPVITGSFIEVNPTCPKYLLSKLGLCSEEVRLPLGELTPKTKETLDNIFETYPKEFFI